MSQTWFTSHTQKKKKNLKDKKIVFCFFFFLGVCDKKIALNISKMAIIISTSLPQHCGQKHRIYPIHPLEGDKDEPTCMEYNKIYVVPIF